MIKYFIRCFLFFLISWIGLAHSEGDLFQDLELVSRIDKEVHDQLPFFYNYSMVGGYFNMPSARMPKSGVVGLGGSYLPPYTVYGVNFQILDRIELSANYRIYNGILEKNFGGEGFGDDAERIGNIKIGILTPEDGFPMLPSIVFGADDFIGTKRFNAQYVAMTKQFLDWNLECTIGFGKKRIKGFFGGAAWSPLRHCKIPFFKDLSFLIEYDATNYKKHAHEHPQGKKVKSRINAGISFVGWDTLQLDVSSVRGVDIAASASLRYPIGSSSGFLPKIKDPKPYLSPVDTEPIGVYRLEEEFVQQMAYSFAKQGLDLYTVYLLCDKTLWIKIVNNRYRLEKVVKEKIEHVLAALLPSDIKGAVVVVEADALPCLSYTFRTEDLARWRLRSISDYELDILGSMSNPVSPPGEYDAALLFQRKRPIWTFTILPRLLTFFGSSSGKFKYNLSAVA
ncbi:MAG: YjbH domain-containing protein, partial [Chlamydiales bacterium]|nr:YjbH domain-containing protein [Chlamydiales bacterium]